MRFVVHGAGAVGCVLGGRLFEQGHEVVLVARGEHLAALQRHGLSLASPSGTQSLPVPAVGHPAEIGWQPDDVVFVATKTQDSAGALAQLAGAAPPGIAVVCAQNGVENERLALRHFQRVYGMMVSMPAEFLEPGCVRLHAAPVGAALALGRAPHGQDVLVHELAGLLTQAGFRAAGVSRIQRWKFAKLLGNLGNALEAACGPDAELDEVEQRLRDEATACYRAAGIDWTADAELRAFGSLETAPVAGRGRSGGSSWQSLQRGTGSIEADWLNGEIVLLGRLHGVPTPVNERVQQLANCLARERVTPGSLSADELCAAVLDGTPPPSP